MLQFKEWINVNVINRTLDILLQSIRDYDKNYWIFNTYTMEYLMFLNRNRMPLQQRFIRIYLKETYFNMRSYIVHEILTIYTGQ